MTGFSARPILDERFRKILSDPRLAGVRKISYFPILSEETNPQIDLELSYQGSKYLGQQLIAETLFCKLCKQQLSLFLQIQSDPAIFVSNTPTGTLQVLSCLNPDCDNTDNFERYMSQRSVVRFIPASAIQRKEHKLPARVSAFRFTLVNCDSFPFWGDPIFYDELQTVLTKFQLSDDDKEIFLSQLGGGGPCEMGDKFGGYPDWIQGNEPKRCPKCNSEEHLQFLLQLGERQDWGFTAGGSNFLIYIFQCRIHPTVFTVTYQIH